MRRERFTGPGRSTWMIEMPATRRERMRGLRDRPGLEPCQGMLFTGCRSVHTFGMRSEILVVGLDRDLRVRQLWRLAPRRLIMPRAGIRHVLECHERSEIRVGDRFTPDRLERGLSAAGGKRPATLRPSRR